MASIAVFCGSSNRVAAGVVELAGQAGAALAQAGHTLVWGGSRSGLMGAVARGARAHGGRTVGVTTRGVEFAEDVDTDCDELLTTSDLGTRKTAMIDAADAVLVLPGGLGTLDELFEVWTTGALRLHDKPVVVLDPDGFYTGLWRWLAELVTVGFVAPVAFDRVRVVDSVPAALLVLG